MPCVSTPEKNQISLASIRPPPAKNKRKGSFSLFQGSTGIKQRLHISETNRIARERFGMARRGSADLLVKRRASLLSLYIAHRIGFRLRQKIARARPLRISFKIRVICIFSAQKLQDNLHNFLHVLRIVFSGKISVKKFYETFAMLDKSVYHIFGEDCARCAKNARFSAKSPRALGL